MVDDGRRLVANDTMNTIANQHHTIKGTPYI